MKEYNELINENMKLKQKENRKMKWRKERKTLRKKGKNNNEKGKIRGNIHEREIKEMVKVRHAKEKKKGRVR